MPTGSLCGRTLSVCVFADQVVLAAFPYLAGVEDQLDQLRHQSVGHGQGLEVGVHQGGQQHGEQMAQHGGFGHLLQAF